MAMTDRDEIELEDLFAEARALRPEPPGELMARILAAAEVEAQAQARAAPPPAARRPGRGWLAGLAQALGGWPAIGGLAASTALGLFLGLAQPAGLSEVAASLWGEEVSVSLALDQDPLSLLEG